MLVALAVVTTTGLAAAVAAFALTAAFAVFVMAGRTLGAYYVGLVNAIEADLAVVAYFDNLNLDDVADVQHIFNLAYAAIGHARDMKQAVLARGKAISMVVLVSS